MSIISLLTSVNRGICVADGSVEWWNLASSVIITAICIKFYLRYRRELKKAD